MLTPISVFNALFAISRAIASQAQWIATTTHALQAVPELGERLSGAGDALADIEKAKAALDDALSQLQCVVILQK